MINKVNYLLKKSGLSITPLRKEVLAFLLENEVSSLDDIKKNPGSTNSCTFWLACYRVNIEKKYFVQL